MNIKSIEVPTVVRGFQIELTEEEAIALAAMLGRVGGKGHLPIFREVTRDIYNGVHDQVGYQAIQEVADRLPHLDIGG